MLDRRKLLLSLGSTVLLGGALAACQTGSPALGQPIGSIKVDVSPLVTQGWGANAAAVKATLERELAASFAGRIQPGGPAMVVRVNSILMPSFVGGGGGGGGSGRWGGGDGGGGTDYMDSETRIIGRGGAVIATYPVLSAVPSGSSGPWHLPDIDRRRLATLARHSSAWIARSVGV